ncbi:MAG TPA: aldehyde dehydrogenase family protein [Candidatus Hydrogenedentes bacterium]|nr:aldehyde dehydrogenase family protein [Candidatus Hydrogenedentota bacterium]HPG68419.1 aldehyde dehydrogenase family protein [Candidatus Hydrogenedentota bacterium]
MSGIEVRNPRTGEVLYTIAECSDHDLDEIFDRATAAHKVVSALSVGQRVAEAVKLKRYILDRRERIVAQLVQECGKCCTDALLAEIYSVLDMIQYYERNAERILRPQKAPTPLPLWPRRSRVWFEPIGPVLVISPWNYPFVLSFQPVISAFLAGNSVMLKPSSNTPLKGLYEEMIAESGFIKDAIQVVYGTRHTGNKLIGRKPRKVFFTGSVGAGRQIMAQAAQYLIPVELELGGKDPMLVFEDADLDRAARGALWGAMVNSGQTCTSVERIYVQEGAYEAFLAKMKAAAEKLRTLENTNKVEDETELDMGCMTTDFQVRTVREHVDEAVAAGARIITGGHCAAGTRKFAPTVVADVTPAMRIVNEESFGPVVAVAMFRTEAEAIVLANASDFGLSASVWSRDLDRAQRVAHALDTGNVSINNALATQANSALPFGGVKHSGFGRYKADFGLYSFSNVKSVLIDKGAMPSDPHWYPYSRRKYALFSKMIEALFRGKRPSLARMAPHVLGLAKLLRERL